jgi:hypothetical protein
MLLVALAGLALLVAAPFAARTWLRWGASSLLAFFLIVAPYLIYNLQLTGGLLPNTAAAKQAEYAVLLALPLPTRIVTLLIGLAGGAHALLLPGVLYFIQIAVQRETWRRRILFLLPLVWAAALIMLYAVRLPVAYQHARYVIPALPSFIICGIVGTGWLLRRFRRPLIARMAVRVLALSTLVAALTFLFVIGPAAYRQDVSIINEEMVAASRWIADNVPADELLAVHDIGALGYFAPRPIVDLAGLVSPEVIPVIRDGDALWAMLQARSVRYLMALPDQIPGQNPHDARLCPVYSTGGPTSQRLGQGNMMVYALAWDGQCIKK